MANNKSAPEMISPWLLMVSQANDPFPFAADKDLSQRQLDSAQHLMHVLADKTPGSRKEMWLRAKQDYDRMQRINAAKNLGLGYYVDPTYRGEPPNTSIEAILKGK